MEASPTPPFFWLHLKKCAGQSFRKSFSPPYVETDRSRKPPPFDQLPREEWNDAINAYQCDLGEYDYKRMLYVRDVLYSKEEFDAMYKFAIVRNPYDRILSAWKFLYRKRHWHPSRYSYARFLRSLPRIWKSKWDRHVATHTAPIWPDVTDNEGNLLVDDLFRLEAMEEAIPIINARLGTHVAELSHKNKKGVGPSYREFYTDETRQLVAELYREDLEHLGYEF